MKYNILRLSIILIVSISIVIYFSYIIYLINDCEVNVWYEKGSTYERYILPVDIYIIENSLNSIKLSDSKIVLILDEVNSIWNDYGITFQIDNIKRVNLQDKSMWLFFQLTSNSDDIKYLGELVAKNKFHDRTIDIIFIEQFGILDYPGAQGKALNTEDIHASIITLKGNVTWNLAHELGHVLNNLDVNPSLKHYTLMTNGSCIKTKYYPTILNQTQVDLVMKEIPSLRFINVTKP